MTIETPELYFDPDPKTQSLLHQWVFNELKYPVGDFAPDGKIFSLAFGVKTGNETIAVIIYHEFKPHVPSVQISVAAKNPGWLTRKIIRKMAYYTFVQLGVNRVWGQTSKYNKKARKLFERLGFTYEGRRDGALPGGKNAYAYRMLKQECNWNYGLTSGSARPTESGGCGERANRIQY